MRACVRACVRATHRYIPAPGPLLQFTGDSGLYFLWVSRRDKIHALILRDVIAHLIIIYEPSCLDVSAAAVCGHGYRPNTCTMATSFAGESLIASDSRPIATTERLHSLSVSFICYAVSILCMLDIYPMYVGYYVGHAGYCFYPMYRVATGQGKVREIQGQ